MGVIVWIVLGAVAGLIAENLTSSRRRAPRAQVVERRTYDDAGQPPA